MDKIEIARRQLGMALELFIDKRDPASVHCLACGGGEIAEQLTRKAGQEPFSSRILRNRPDLDEGRIRGLRNEFWNAFKHATTREGVDRDDEELLATFSDAANDHALYIGWADYRRAGLSLPIEAQVFQAWYFAMYPEKVDPARGAEDPIRIFGADLPSISRGEAKSRLRTVIEHFRQSKELMEDPSTDVRPLDLGA